jgi:short-subunit dehydrogenase
MNAVITGASRGMGKAIAKIFALHGYNLFLTARTETTLLQAVEELKTEFPTITIGAKAYDATIQKCVVLMKDELEKAKEQVLNVL